VSNHPLLEAAAAIGTAIAAGFTWLHRHTLQGWVQRGRKRTDGGHDLNGDVHEIKETLSEVQVTTEQALHVAQDTQEDVEEVGDKVDAVADTVYYLHRDDPAVEDEDAFTGGLDVDPADDFMRSSSEGDHE